MNAKSGSGSSGSFIWGALVGLIAILGMGGLYLSGAFTGGSQSEQQSQEQAVVAPQTTPTEDAAPTPEATAQGAAESDQAPQKASELAADDPTEETQTADPQAGSDNADPATPPALDQIFLSTDGNALISGEAQPGSQVDVLVNGEVLHQFTVDDTGQFAEFVSVPFSEDPQGLVLQSIDGDKTTQSDDYLIAALPEPVPDAPLTTTETPTDELADVDVANDQAAQPEEDGVATAQAEPTWADQATEEATEDQQVAVLRSGEEGVELVPPPSTETAIPEQVELDTIGYSDTGDVQLTGRVSEGSAVRLYLDNRLVADLTPEEDGNWRGELEGIDAGVYTLRVDEVNTDGTVLSRVETPFKRETIEVLQAAEAQEPDQSAGAPAVAIRSVTVQAGDTLWAISRERFGDGVLYVRLFEANRALIRDPDLIYPGQIFTIPE